MPVWRLISRIIRAGRLNAAALLAAAVVILTASARAEEKPANADPPARPGSAAPPPVAPSEAKHPAEASGSNPAIGTSAVVLDLSAVQGIIGRSVKTTNGEDMGRVVDLLVAPSGQVRAAVLDFGGVLGVGARKVAVDWKVLSFAELAKDGPVQVLLTRNQIRVAPEYKSNEPVVVLQATPDPREETNAGARAAANPSQPQAQPKPRADTPTPRADTPSPHGVEDRVTK